MIRIQPETVLQLTRYFIDYYKKLMEQNNYNVVDTAIINHMEKLREDFKTNFFCEYTLNEQEEFQNIMSGLDKLKDGFSFIIETEFQNEDDGLF